MKNINNYLKIAVLFIFAFAIFGCSSKATKSSDIEDPTKAKEFVAEVSSAYEAGEIYLVSYPEKSEVDVSTLIKEGYLKVSNNKDEYSGKITDKNGELYVSYSNNQYKTNGSLSLKEIDIDHIVKK